MKVDRALLCQLPLCGHCFCPCAQAKLQRFLAPGTKWGNFFLLALHKIFLGTQQGNVPNLVFS
jgi:hypothetical protein